ncbi:MAG: hypothetical protein KIS78_03715 [Labilithrix sp.]|nr:hypothetical protein [Labilithrix sp.]
MPASAARLAARIADALAAAHAVNVIHRDLKPENVFLVGAGRSEPEEDIRVVDFGAATILGGSKLTRPGIVFGTPSYMSPEQASGEPIDGAPTCTRSASCCSRCSPAARRSRPRRTWAC